MTPSLRAQLAKMGYGKDCDQKRAWPTAKLALHAATITEKHAGWKLRAYRCDHCSKWHLTKKLFFHRTIMVVKDTEAIPLLTGRGDN
jgi:hypothetical protein